MHARVTWSWDEGGEDGGGASSLTGNKATAAAGTRGAGIQPPKLIQ
jgi:hypothetical protein